MSSAPQPRKTFKISDSLNGQLNTYALVASAAGVGVLALAGASEANRSLCFGSGHTAPSRITPNQIKLE